MLLWTDGYYVHVRLIKIYLGLSCSYFKFNPVLRFLYVLSYYTVIPVDIPPICFCVYLPRTIFLSIEGKRRNDKYVTSRVWVCTDVFRKRIVYKGIQTHVIIREIGHTLVARIMKYMYSTTTTYNILRSKNRHKYLYILVFVWSVGSGSPSMRQILQQHWSRYILICNNGFIIIAPFLMHLFFSSF